MKRAYFIQAHISCFFLHRNLYCKYVPKDVPDRELPL